MDVPLYGAFLCSGQAGQVTCNHPLARLTSTIGVTTYQCKNPACANFGINWNAPTITLTQAS